MGTRSFGGICSFCGMQSRDDLRTRNAAAGIRRGSGSESRERREDGAVDHNLQQANSESVRG
jgi:hypothetical protein